MKSVVFVGIGGAIGACLRYLIALLMKPPHGYDFPIHTLTINVTGCFLIGWITMAWSNSNSYSEFVEPFWIVGVLGGFTTFSSFALETKNLVMYQRHTLALLYVALSNSLGILAAFMGFHLNKLLGA